jgi:xanthine dehydrogenase iron-sulfur cluster and FAD-binding subunit A
MLTGNYCRCTGFRKPIEAVLAAAQACRAKGGEKPSHATKAGER